MEDSTSDESVRSTVDAHYGTWQVLGDNRELALIPGIVIVQPKIESDVSLFSL
jgi:hypothetical protein